MANLLKKQVNNILEKDVNDEEIDHFMIILDQNTAWSTKTEVSTTEVSQNVQNFFLNNIQGFLQQYSPLYTEFKEIISSVSELDISLNRMEECMSELRIKNMIILSKLQKLQAKESQIDEKISLLGELISKISLDRPQLETFLSDDTPVDDQFLELFNNLDNIEEMDNFLIGDSLENTTLRNSLMKNTNEIKSIGFTKLLKYLNRNIESVPHELLKKSIQLIMKNSKMQENLQKILNIRKNVLNSQFKNLAAKHEKYETPAEFFWALINDIDEALENELDLFNGEEKMDLKAMEFLFEDMFRDIEGKITKYTHEEGHNFLEVYKITNYFYYMETSVTAKLNKYSPGYFEANPISRFRSHLVGFTTSMTEYFKKRLERSIEVPSDPSNLDLVAYLATIYDNLDKVKVILRYIDSSYLPTSREEKVLPLNRAFYIPSLTLLLNPLNRAIRMLLALPRDRAREGHIHVILILSNLDKLYKELKLAVKKMDELVRSQENVRSHLRETIATLCVINLRELVGEYEFKKEQIKASVEGENVQIDLNDKEFYYKDDYGKIVSVCVGICKNDIRLKEIEAEAWLDKDYRKILDRRFREILMILYEKGLNKLLDYTGEKTVGENLVKELERIFEVEEGRIELEDVEIVRRRFVGAKENEEDIEANIKRNDSNAVV